MAVLVSASPYIMQYQPHTQIPRTTKINGTLGTLEHSNDFKDLQTPQMEHYKPTLEHCSNINNLAWNITFWCISDSLPYTPMHHLTHHKPNTYIYNTIKNTQKT